VSDFGTLPPIWFIRHGETDWNRDRRVQGQTDIPLNATGIAQAEAVARELVRIIPDPSDFELVVSPLVRARQTMSAVLSCYRLGENSVRIEPDVREKSFGDFEGKTWPEFHAAGIRPELEPEFYYDWRPDGGESHNDVARRVVRWISTLNRPTIVVSHGAVSRILRGLIFRIDKGEVVNLPVPQTKFYRIMNGSLDWFDVKPLRS